MVHSTPSGQTWSVEGGGFCDATYKVYNNTVGTTGLYAENCATGVNDYGPSTDLGAIVASITGASTFGAHIKLAVGLFNVVTPITLSKCSGSVCNGGFWLQGSGSGGTTTPSSLSPYTQALNATLLMAKTAGMNMIQCSNAPGAAGPSVHNVMVSDLGLEANGKASVGINCNMSEIGGSGDFVDDVRLTTEGIDTAICPGGFTTGIIFDGVEDGWISRLNIQGDGNTSHCSAAVGIQWQVPVGNINIVNSFDGSAITVAGTAQTWNLSGDTIEAVKLLGSGGGPGTTQNINLAHDYICNALSSIIQTNGFTANIVSFTDGTCVFQGSGTFMITGAGTIKNFYWSGVTYIVGVGQTWTSGGPTVNKYTTSGSNNTPSGANLPTGFPAAFVVDGNGNF